MTVKVLQRKKMSTTQKESDAWELVRGMWKNRKPDALKYQKTARRDRG